MQQAEERWSEFRYQYIETGWFDYDRQKTIEALRRLCQHIPDALELFPSSLIVFAPSTAKLGEVFPELSVRAPGSGCVFLYLSPQLEKLSQKEVDFTVAHEFAHVVLGHYKPGSVTNPSGMVIEKHEDVPAEQEADRLAESWGFVRPRCRKQERTRRGISRDRRRLTVQH